MALHDTYEYANLILLGIMMTPFSRTVDGFELQFAVNHLAHYLLTTLLLPTLMSSSTPEFNSRVVAVTSAGHRYSTVPLDDPNFTKPNSYDPLKSYAQSKLANIWLANYIDRVYGPKGVRANSVHPGGIWTGLQAFTPADTIEKWKADPTIEKKMMTSEQGAATTVWAAAAKAWEGKGGKYLSNCEVAAPSEDLLAALDPGYAAHAYDPEGEDRLWELSAKLVGA